MKRISVLLGVILTLSGCMSMRDVGIGLQTGAAGAAGNGSGGVIIAPVLWVTGLALELAGNAVQSPEISTEKQQEKLPEVQ